VREKHYEPENKEERMGRRVVLVLAAVSVLATAWPVRAAENKKFDYGASLRLREEYFENIWDFNAKSATFQSVENYFRLKASLWGKWNFTENISLFAKLTTEPDIYMTTGPNSPLSKGKNVNDNEGIFDNLYLDIKNVFGLPVDLRVGRQDFLFTYGEGFIILDGTPYDGSRTTYFNAARLTWKINEKNSLDLIYISDPDRDIYLPVINDLGRQLNTSDERAYVIYGKLKPLDNFSLEPYYIYKIEGSYTKNTIYTPTLGLHTFGARAVASWDTWKIRGELAGQNGEYTGGRDREGLGGYAYLTKSFPQALFKPSLDVGFAYLSGDDPTTAKNEGWDPIFSRWPWISELYLFAYAVEGGEPAYWTNTQVYRANLSLALTQKVKLDLAYNYLRANENGPNPVFFGTGKERGHMPQCILNWKLNKNIDGHIWVEYFVPGSYHAGTDPSLMLRWQCQLRWP